MTSHNRGLSLLLVALVLLPAGAGVAMAATVDSPSGINYGADSAPNPKVSVGVTKDVHHVGDWSPTQYEGDNGEVQSLEAHVNSSDANPVTLVATEINESDFTQFPRNSGESENSASWVDASEWTTTVSDTTNTALSVTETTTAPNVEALQIATGGAMGSGDTATATYSNFSIDSDEAKRNIQLAVNVNTLDAGAHAEIRVVDADGDYKSVIVDPDNSTSAANVLANATGDGYVLQQQLGQLSTTTVSGSDGTFDNIEKVEVVVEDADASLTFSLVNTEKMGRYTFGQQAYDGDDDDSEKDETRTLYEPTGAYEVTGVDTLGDTFQDATVRNVDVEMLFAASDLTKAMDAQVNYTKASAYPSFEWKAQYNYRIELPSAYDLSYSDAELVFTAGLPESRYQSVSIAEGVGDTNFSDISSWTDVTSSINTDEQVVLDATIQPGQQIAFESVVLQTGEDKQSALATGGVVGTTGGGSGGIVDFLLSLPGMIVSAVLGLVGIKAAKG